MTTVDTPQAAIQDDFSTIANFSSVIAVALGVIYFLARSGFENPVLPLVNTVALSLFIVNFPQLGRFLIRRFGGQADRWLDFELFMILIGIALLILVSKIGSLVGISFLLGVVLIGYFAFGQALLEWLRTVRLTTSLLFVIIALLFSVWIAGTVWESTYKNPLFRESLPIDQVHLDGIFHLSIANMIKTYGRSSTGLDGLPYLSYHFGSHWVFAQLADLLHMSLLDFYQLGFPVIVIPLFYRCLLSLAVLVRHKLGVVSGWNLRQDYWFWAGFIMTGVGLLPLAVQSAMMMWNDEIIDESYCIALTFSCILVGTLIPFLFNRELTLRTHLTPPAGRGMGGEVNEELKKPIYRFMLLFMLPIMIGLLTWLKTSNTFVLLPLFTYLFLRLGLYKDRVLLLSFVMSFAVGAGLFLAFTLRATATTSIAPFDLFMTWVPNQWKVWWPFYYFGASGLFVALVFWYRNIRSLADLKNALLHKRLIDVESIMVICLVGMIPGSVWVISNASAIYFSDIQRWAALVLLLAISPLLLKRLKAIKWAPLVRVLAVLLVIAMLTVNLSQHLSNAIARNLVVRTAIDTFQTQDDYRAKVELLNALTQLAALPRAEKMQTLLFIPQTNALYWNLLSNCMAVPFVAPAISEMAMLDGTPPLGCNAREYGYSIYTLRTAEQRLNAADTIGLCAASKAKGFQKIIVLDAPNGQDITTKKIECTDAVSTLPPKPLSVNS